MLPRKLDKPPTRERDALRLHAARRRDRTTGRLTRRSRSLRPALGQSLVEFALMLPVVMLVLLLTIDVGRLYYGWVDLQNAARIGANFAALHPTAWGGTPDPAAQAAYVQQIQDEAAAINCVLPASVPDPTFIAGGATSLGEARVDLSCRFDVITPKLLGIQSLQLGSNAIFPIRSGTLPVVPPAPTAPPTPPPAPTPTPTGMCTVPVLIGTAVDGAASAWIAAGFDVTNINIELGTGNYTIVSEGGADLGQALVPGVYDGQSENCAAFVLTVGP